MLTIATWNVNSVSVRLPRVLDWLRTDGADIVCLQELKCEEARFPRLEIEDLGYNVLVHGQKSFNGVAILSRYPLEEAQRGLPDDPDPSQARYLEAVASLPGEALRVASIYLPNGNPVESQKFAYKLAWMERLNAHARELLAFEEVCALAGDYNVIPREVDCRDPGAWAGDALFQPESRARYRTLLNLGYVDAYMAADGRAGQFTFWDYQAGAWQRDNGIRIDHIALSPQAADRLVSVRIDRDERDKEKPSDHVPVVATLRLGARG